MSRRISRRKGGWRVGLSRGLELAALPLAALLIAGLGWLVTADAPERPPSGEPVDVAAYACPMSSGVSMAAGQVRAGTGALAQSSPSGRTVTKFRDATRWRVGRPTGVAIRLEQRGKESGAVGFIGGKAPSGSGGGLVVGACPTVTDDAWFMGLGSGRGHESSLVLTNFGGSPAVADIRLWTSKGPVAAIDNIGRIVEPHSSVRLAIDDIAAGEPEVAVQVLRRRGSMSVAALDTSRASRKGTESLVGSSPAKRLVLAAVPGKSSDRGLQLFNPGDETARIRVQIMGERSPFTPQGLDDIKVGPGKLRVVVLPSSVSKKDFAVEVTGDRPVVGAVRFRSGAKDFAYATPAQAVEQVAVAPVSLGEATERPIVVLTASGKTITATVTAYDARMKKLSAIKRKVKGGSSLAVNSGAFTASGIAYLTVEGGAGLIGAAVYDNGGLLAVLPLADAPITRPGPHVQAAD